MTEAVQLNVEDLLQQARALPYGPGRVAVVEEAVRYADAHTDVDSGYEARMELLDAAVMGGRGDLLVAHYPWCLAQFDRDPDRFDEYQLLWRFKWVMGHVLEFPQISLGQIDGLFEEMADRFRRYGAGDRVLAGFQLSLAKHRGVVDDAARSFDEFLAHPRDSLSNCAACDANAVVGYHRWRGDHAAAVRSADRILANRLACRRVPENTHATLLHSLLELGDDAQAVALHQQGLRSSTASGDLSNLAKHLTFLARTDNLAPAVRLFEKFLPNAAAGYEPESRFAFLMAGRFLCDRLLANDWRRGLRVPPALTSTNRKTTSDVATLRAWLDAECRQLAAQFDERNATDQFSKRIAEQADLHAKVRPVPLTRD
ncbi:hypothetical protein [Limnoglobus roseus]|nr:hypothetical protein [Limnoglobus roseus]